MVAARDPPLPRGGRGRALSDRRPGRVRSSHPAEVTVGERGLRMRRAGPWQVLKRWVKAIGFEPAPCPQPSALHRRGVHRARRRRDGALRCGAGGGDPRGGGPCRRSRRRLPARLLRSCRPRPTRRALDDTATSQRLRHRVLLRHWAEPLKLAGDANLFHVLEATNPADGPPRVRARERGGPHRHRRAPLDVRLQRDARRQSRRESRQTRRRSRSSCCRLPGGRCR